MQCREFTLLEAKLEHFHRFELPGMLTDFHVRPWRHPCMPAGDTKCDSLVLFMKS
jgi:hypothetical protein